jgi:hypothetical protein
MRGQKGEDSRNRSARRGQAEMERQNKTAMTELPGQGGQDRAARIGLSAQE